MRLPWSRSENGGSRAGAGEVALPNPPAAAELRMPGGERLPARVTAREGEELVILTLLPMPQPLSEAELGEIVVELTGRGGLMRLGGDAVLEDRDVLRFRNLCSLDMLQRRDYVRVKANRKVLLRVTGSPAPVECASLDLSGGGMLLSGLEQLEVGQRVEFRLLPGEGAPEITGGATVVRSDPGGRRAIAFEEITDGNRRRLIRFLFDRQREELRKGLLRDGDGR